MRNVLLIAFVVVVAGCSSGNVTAVNNRLRAEGAAKDREISGLKGKVASDEQVIASLQGELNGKEPRVQTLPAARLAELFTVGSIEIQKGTDVWRWGEGAEKREGIRLFLRTVTGDGMVVPATGKLVVEAFELPSAPAEPKRLGEWEISAGEMKKNWYSGLGLNHFAFNLPLKGGGGAPRQADVTLKATFTDALTGNVFTAHLDKKMTLP